jgi:hypothetical protein
MTTGQVHPVLIKNDTSAVRDSWTCVGACVLFGCSVWQVSFVSNTGEPSLIHLASFVANTTRPEVCRAPFHSMLDDMT